MTGSVIDKTVIRREAEHINRIYPETTSQKKLILLVSDNSLETIALYCYHMMKRNTVLLVGDKKVSDIGALIRQFMPDEIFMNRKKVRDAEAEPDLHRSMEDYQTCFPYYQYVRFRRKRRSPDTLSLYDDLALLMVTSGSVGNGKLVALSYDNLKSNAQAIIQSLEIDENDSAGVLLPVSYVYGLSVVNSHLLAGGSLLLPAGSMFQRGYWDFLEACGVTSFCGVPYTYEILDWLRILSRPWKKLRLLTQAGGAMSRDMKQKLLEWIYDRRHQGITTHLAVMYGQTEATARMSTFFLDQHPDKLDSVGRAVPGGAFQIKNGDYTGAGDIYYRGANVCLGYVMERADLSGNAAIWRQSAGLLDTGDVGRLDDEGYLYITGRKKRFIKCNGVRISLDELERSIENRWKVPVVCIAKVSNEQLTLFIRTEDFGNLDRVELEGYLRQLGITKGQCQVRKVREFPYCDNGKIDYAGFCEGRNGE
ncbi:AMP-binding protein [Jutongia huaianensis]|uniref:AMP-binding protein n=1 Tax=Jutongia huaianensis TaxID=2763668 RepID=A0ABR7N0F2_9FIRM|nr:AMP-binding protein [Jutongia huaianensis]MBC8562109.1 AMP-binding protein [Jutongia huaianensis]